MLWLTTLLSSAFAGQIVYEQTTLSKMVAASDIIVEAVVADPPTGTESVAVAPEKGKCQPIVMKTYKMTVIDVMHDNVGLKEKKGRMTVREGNGRALVDVTARHCLSGVRKSPLLYRYGEKRTLKPGDRVLYFVKFHKGWGFELVAQWAHAPATKKGKVIKLIDKTKPMLR